MFSQGNKFSPVIEKIDYREDGFSVYKMPLYSKVKAPKKELNEKAYKIYNTLRSISVLNCTDYNSFVEQVEASDIEEDYKEEILNLVGDVCNGIDCDDMGFEISPRNISKDAEGNLIMLDCFFSRKLLRSTYKKINL